METVIIRPVKRTVVTELSPNVIEVNLPGPSGPVGGPGPAGPAVADGDKGDIVVSGGGATWTIDPALLSAFMRSALGSADAAAARTAFGAQAQSAILDATTASFLTAHATKLGHITVTQAVDLDAIETRVNALDAAVILKGAWDASAGTFPGGGTAQAGESWIVSVAGTVGGVAFAVNDRVIAVADNASTTNAANWFKADYTDQVLSVAGKTGTVTLQVADITDMTANGRSLVSAADYAAMKVLLSLGNVTNTSDANKPVSTAQQTALDLKANAATVSTITPTPTPSGGAYVNVTSSLRVIRDASGRVTVRGRATVTDKGTATGNMFINVPNAAARAGGGGGRESGVTGKGLAIGIAPGASTLSISMADGTTPNVNGYLIDFSLTYDT